MRKMDAKPYVMCVECGLKVHGISVKQAESMMPYHKKGKLHKRIIQMNKEKLLLQINPLRASPLKKQKTTEDKKQK